MTNELYKISERLKCVLFSGYFLVGIVFLLSMPDGLSFEMVTNYLLITASYYLVAGIWIAQIFKSGIYIFEPATMVLSLTIITFSIEPLISIITGNLDVMGFYVYGGCKKATMIYMFAAIAFILCYYGMIQVRRPVSSYERREEQEKSEGDFEVKNRRRVVILAYLFAFIGIGISVADLVVRGYSLRYILSLGTSGILETGDGRIGVFINLRYFLIPSLLYLYKYSKWKWLPYSMAFVSFACMFMLNKRWIIVVLFLSPLVLYSVEHRKKPKGSIVLLAALTFAVLIGAMQYMRKYTTSSLTETVWDKFDMLEIWKGFSGNFDLYKTLYAAVTYFPSEHFYTLGRQMIFLTIITSIPRAIWPGKPISIFETLKGKWLGEGAVRGTWAYAQLTEFYVEFGIVGAIGLMAAFGMICRKLRLLYERRSSIHDLIIYAFCFPLLMQFVIRGYMPNNFWPLMFMLVPCLIIRYFDR